MRLVIFGLSVSSAWGNGHATLWRGLFRELARRGHHVTFYEQDVPYYATHRDYFEIPHGRLVLYSDWESIRREAERELRDADVGMVTSYCPDGVAASELVVQSGAGVRCFYDLDTPVTLTRLRQEGAVPYLGPDGLRGFDLALSYTGGYALEELQSRLGAPRVAPLYGSVDPEVHRPVPLDERYRADVSYLGTYAADRQAMLERIFIEPARALPDARFLIGGAQYPPDFPWTKNIWFLDHVAPAEHPAFYASSRYTVSVTRKDMRECGYCPSGRLFEAAACGTPVITDSWDGLAQFFTPGEEILVADTTAEAMAALQQDEPLRQRIGRRARERALAEHTAAHRAVEMLAQLEWASRPCAAGGGDI